jgi:toxin ParE1/3/4
MSRYIISPTASRDLEEIIDYFTERDINAGERFVAEFNKRCRNLIQFPNLGRSYADLAPLLRGISLDGYIIFYKPANDEIEIVRVVSGYRDLPALFSLPDAP